MDFPSSLPPSLFTTGPLGLSDVPDVSFMCSWRDALTLPESLPQGSEVRLAGRALVAAGWVPSLGPPILAFTPVGRSAEWGGIGTNLLRHRLSQNPLLWGPGMPCHPQRVY